MLYDVGLRMKNMEQCFKCGFEGEFDIVYERLGKERQQCPRCKHKQGDIILEA